MISGAPEGYDAILLGDVVAAAPGRAVLHVARDDARMARLAEGLGFFHPDLECLLLPAWDCLPYDRVSPNPAVVSQRMDTLSRLAPAPDGSSARIVLTTVNALLQRVPARATLADARLDVSAGERLGLETLTGFLARNGYARTGAVMEPGEYAPRGGLVDVFPPGQPAPLRIDFFGDDVESIRRFDPLTQCSTDRVGRVALQPVSELRLDSESIARFRAGYLELFGATTGDDPLYQSVSAGRKYIGAEHWLSLFHDRL